MADFNLNLNINGIDTAIASVEDLEVALKASKTEMNTLAIGSEAFLKAQANARKLDSELKNIKISTEGIDTKKMAESFAKLGSGVAGAFAIATQAGELFGTKNEALTQASVKAQQAIAIVMGARAIAEGVVEGRAAARLVIDKLSLLTTGALSTATVVQTTVLEGAAVASGEATVAQIGLNVAMMANPIGLVIAAIAALVAAFAILASSEESEIERTVRLREAQEKAAKQIEDSVVIYKKIAQVKVDQYERELKLMQAQGAGAKELADKEQQIAQQKLNTLSYVKGFRGKLVYEELKEQADLNNQKEVIEATYQTNQRKIIRENADKATKQVEASQKDAAAKKLALQEISDKEAVDLEKLQAINKQAVIAIEYREELKFIKDARDASIKAGNDKLEAEKVYAKASEDLRKNKELLVKASNDEELSAGEKQQVEQLQREGAFIQQLNDNRKTITLAGLRNLELVEEQHAQNLLNIKDKYAILQKQALLTLGGDTDKIKEAQDAIEKDRLNAIEVEEDLYRDRKIAKELAMAQQITQIGASILNETVSLLSEIEKGRKEANDRELNTLRDQNVAKNDENQAAYNAEKSVLDRQYSNGVITKKQYDEKLLAQQAKRDAADKKLQKDFNDAKLVAGKKAFEDDKKLKIASAVISGITGSLQAFMSAMSLPYPANLIVGGISAALVTAMAAVQVANISASQYDGGAPEAAVAPNVSVPSEPTNGVGGASAVSSNGGFTGFTPNAVNGGFTSGPNVGGGTNPTKVYVLESDITSAQRKVSVAESNSTFG